MHGSQGFINHSCPRALPWESGGIDIQVVVQFWTLTTMDPFLVAKNWVSSVYEAVLNIAIPTPDTILSMKLKARNNAAVDIEATNLMRVQVCMWVSVR